MADRRPDRPRRDGKPGQKWVDLHYKAKEAAKAANGGVLPATDSLTSTWFEHCNEWSEENLPDILFYLHPPPSEYKNVPVEYLQDENGKRVKSDESNDIRDFPILPQRIALDVPGWLIETWRRIDSRITYQDILDRQVADPTYGGVGLKKLSKNAMQNHARRDCRKVLTCWVEYGRRSEPHRTEVETIENLSDENLIFNTSLKQSELVPHRLVKVKLVRKVNDGVFHLVPLTVTPENYLQTTFPIDHFVRHLPCPKPGQDMMTPAMKQAFNLMLRLTERAMFHQVTHWSKLERCCLPVSWFDRTKEKSIENPTSDGGCHICTWEYGKVPSEVPELKCKSRTPIKGDAIKKLSKRVRSPPIDEDNGGFSGHILKRRATKAKIHAGATKLKSAYGTKPRRAKALKEEEVEPYASEWQLQSSSDTFFDSEEGRDSFDDIWMSPFKLRDQLDEPKHDDDEKLDNLTPDRPASFVDCYSQSSLQETNQADFQYPETPTRSVGGVSKDGSSPIDEQIVSCVGTWVEVQNLGTTNPLQDFLLSQHEILTPQSSTQTQCKYPTYYSNAAYTHCYRPDPLPHSLLHSSFAIVRSDTDNSSFADAPGLSFSQASSFSAATSPFGETPPAQVDEYYLPEYGSYKPPVMGSYFPLGYGSPNSIDGAYLATQATANEIVPATSYSSPIRRVHPRPSKKIRSASFSESTISQDDVFGSEQRTNSQKQSNYNTECGNTKRDCSLRGNATVNPSLLSFIGSSSTSDAMHFRKANHSASAHMVPKQLGQIAAEGPMDLTDQIPGDY